MSAASPREIRAVFYPCAAKATVAHSRQIDYIDMINCPPKGELRCKFQRKGGGFALPAVRFFSVQ
jgi:hypothetical protein